MKFILIIIMLSSGSAHTNTGFSVEFNNDTACEKAADYFNNKDDHYQRVTAKCFPKS